MGEPFDLLRALDASFRCSCGASSEETGLHGWEVDQEGEATCPRCQERRKNAS